MEIICISVNNQLNVNDVKSHWSVSTHVEQCLTAASFQNIISHCVVSGRHCLKGLCQFCTPVQQFLYWQHNNRRNAMQRQADVLGKWTSSLPELLCHSLVSKAEPWNSQGLRRCLFFVRQTTPDKLVTWNCWTSTTYKTRWIPAGILWLTFGSALSYCQFSCIKD